MSLRWYEGAANDGQNKKPKANQQRPFNQAFHLWKFWRLDSCTSLPDANGQRPSDPSR